MSWGNFGLDVGYIYYAYPGGIIRQALPTAATAKCT